MICKHLETMTDQEVFDTVVTHLMEQAALSSDGSGDLCLYRAYGGLKCAAGCLIPDDEYTGELEGQTWGKLIRSNIVPNVHHKLISGLQLVHDAGRNKRLIDSAGSITKLWTERLLCLAAQFKLSPAIVSQCMSKQEVHNDL